MNSRGAFPFIELETTTDGKFWAGDDYTISGTYVVDTVNNTIELTLEDKDYPVITGTYEIVENDSHEIENVLANFFDAIYVKNPGAISSISGIYVNQDDSNEQYKFQIETSTDGTQFIMRYLSTDGGNNFSRDEACYCLYNSSESCYYLYYGANGGTPSFKFDGNNTITKLGSTDKIYVRQN